MTDSVLEGWDKAEHRIEARGHHRGAVRINGGYPKLQVGDQCVQHQTSENR